MMIFSLLGCSAALAPTIALAPTMRPRAPAAPRMGAIPTVEERTTTARPKYDVGSASTRGSAVRQGPSDFEWALDADASRNDGDNFHILLLNETFAKPRMSVAYAAGALAGFAQAQGFSCLGTWRKDECLELCEQLRG